MTDIQLETLEVIHATFQDFVNRTILQPTLSGAVIDEAVEHFTELLKANLPQPRVAETLRAAAKGIEGGFRTMRVNRTASISNLIGRLHAEAYSLEGVH